MFASLSLNIELIKIQKISRFLCSLYIFIVEHATVIAWLSSRIDITVRDFSSSYRKKTML